MNLDSIDGTESALMKRVIAMLLLLHSGPLLGSLSRHLDCLITSNKTNKMDPECV